MKHFKATLSTVKAYERKVCQLVNQALAHFQKGSLFANDISPLGEVRYDAPGVFRLEGEDISGKKYHSRARIIKVQSPGPGALAVVVRTGRNYLTTVFCTKVPYEIAQYEGSWRCEAVWKQGDESLGTVTYRLHPL